MELKEEELKENGREDGVHRRDSAERLCWCDPFNPGTIGGRELRGEGG